MINGLIEANIEGYAAEQKNGADRVYTMPRSDGEVIDAQGWRVYSINGKSSTLCSTHGGGGAASGLYAIPIDPAAVANGAASAAEKNTSAYEVANGEIAMKGRKYKINLSDGLYIIRKLIANECCRLQTLPDNYCKSVSASRAQGLIGNGWTVDVIAHIFGYMRGPGHERDKNRMVRQDSKPRRR